MAAIDMDVSATSTSEDVFSETVIDEPSGAGASDVSNLEI